MPINASDAAAVIEAVQHQMHLELVVLDREANQNAVAVPRGFELKSLKPLIDEYREAPERIEGCAVLHTLDSFIAHVLRFKSNGSAVFATLERLLAVYDYHNIIGSTQIPDNCKHTAVYTFPYSPEWKAWTQAHGQNMPQVTFAQFLEDRIADITTPTEPDGAHFGELGFALATPAQLLALSRGLHVRVESEAVSKPNLSTGEIEVLFKEAHTDTTGQPLKVPGGFMILVAPFRDGALYRVPVRLRYRVSGGKVQWSLLIYRAEAVVRDALKDACERVIERTSVPLFHGLPESEDDD